MAAHGDLEELDVSNVPDEEFISGLDSAEQLQISELKQQVELLSGECGKLVQEHDEAVKERDAAKKALAEADTDKLAAEGT
jgi:hypothetical protein